MSWRTSSRGDWGKAPAYTTSHEDASSDDETTSTGEQVARVLQSHFDCGGDDPRPTGGIPMETRSRRRCSIETASVSFESRTISNRASSRCRSTTGRWASGGEMRAKDLLIDIEADFFWEKVYPDLGARRRSLRLRFPPHQAEVDACTGAIDRGIKDTHL